MPTFKLIAFKLDEAYIQKIDADKVTTYRISADRLRESEEKINSGLSRFCRNGQIPLNSAITNDMKKTLEIHFSYRPPEVRNFSEQEIKYGLPQAGFISSDIEYTSEDEAIKKLRFFWNVARRNPEAIIRLERRARVQAERSIDSWINGILSK